MDHLHDLVEYSSPITSSTTGVDYNNDNDHEYDDAIPSLLVFELQEFVWPPPNAISIFVTEYKAKAGCGQDVAISATGGHSVRTIVAEGQAPSALYHQLNTDHLIPLVTHRMNITSDSGDSLYSGGEEGVGWLYISFHNTTFDPSTGVHRSD